MKRLKKILTVVAMTVMELSTTGCSSKANSDVIKNLKPTDKVEVEFVKNNDKFCADGKDVLRVSNVISNLRYNQWLLIKALRGEEDEE